MKRNNSYCSNFKNIDAKNGSDVPYVDYNYVMLLFNHMHLKKRFQRSGVVTKYPTTSCQQTTSSPVVEVPLGSPTSRDVSVSESIVATRTGAGRSEELLSRKRESRQRQ